MFEFFVGIGVLTLLTIWWVIAPEQERRVRFHKSEDMYNDEDNT